MQRNNADFRSHNYEIDERSPSKLLGLLGFGVLGLRELLADDSLDFGSNMIGGEPEPLL